MRSDGAHGATGAGAEDLKLDSQLMLEPPPLPPVTSVHGSSVLRESHEVKTSAFCSSAAYNYSHFRWCHWLDPAQQLQVQWRTLVNARIGIVILVVIVGAYLLVKKSAEPDTDASIVRARLTDVRGMPIGAPVTLAGLDVGVIVERRVGSGYAEIDIQFASRIDLRKDATLYKRRTSLLSGPSLEIDPGRADQPLPTIYIERVIETSNIGDILYEISEALPAVRTKSEEGVARTESLRVKITGPFQDKIIQFDEAAKDIQERMHGRLQKMDEGLKVAERMDFNARAAIEPKIARTEELTKLARAKLESAREWVTRSASATRHGIEDTKWDWQKYSDPITKVDEGEGTLGKLLNSPEAHDDVVEVTGAMRRYLRSIADWKMRVGLRGEFGIRTGKPRAYVTLKAGRSDRYFYIELLASPNGSAPQAQVTFDSTTGQWRRDLSIESGLRFTAQWARRLGPAVFRYGVKESSFGAGADFHLIAKRLELSADLFDFDHSDRPHLKLAATYRVFGQLFILAGLDDVLNPGQRYNIAPIGSDQPQSLDEIYVGREFYLGGTLRFTDHDLAGLLRIGGDAIASLVSI